MRVVRVSDLCCRRPRVKGLAVHGVTGVVTHEPWLQVGTVIKATLLPTYTAGNTTCATALATAYPTHTADLSRRGLTGSLAVARSTVSALTGGAVTCVVFAEIVMQATG